MDSSIAIGKNGISDEVGSRVKPSVWVLEAEEEVPATSVIHSSKGPSVLNEKMWSP